jgi:rRNA processing
MGRTDNSKSSTAPRRRAGTSIDDFANRKGVTKAIQDFRKRKEKKRTETAKALRQYKKTMKQEGFEPGRGASRKRTTEEEASSTDHPKKPKSNPFQKSLQKAEVRKQQNSQAAAERESNEKEREKKIKERRKRSKMLRQRTSKGQPVMKHVIHDILRKLEREKKEEEKEE